MMLDPTPATLFCGMGGHARSVFLYINKYALQKIYVIYSKYNTEYYEAKITSIKQDIAKRLEALDHAVHIYYIQINEEEFLQSYYALVRLYNQEKNNYVITDLTAGHKSISYIMFYAHTFMKPNFKKESKLVFLFEGKDNPISMPDINIKLLNKNLECFFQDINYFQNHDLTEKIPREDNEGGKIKSLSLSRYLTHGPTFSGKLYTPSTSYRYKKELKSVGYLNNELNITIEGKMFLFARNL